MAYSAVIQPDLFTKPAFYNTVGLAGSELKEAKAQTSKQDIRVLAIYRQHGKLSPWECWRLYCGLYPECPLTSVRRSINSLTGLKMLRKTTEKREGGYGMMNYVWQIV